jgi:peptidoglycan/xylan/chitin deacetylase (PgdA/CDA1 family)
MQRPLRKLYLLYHELLPHSSKYSYALEAGAFQKHVDLFVRLREAAEPGLYPEITFDDGHISNFEFALPILQSRGFKAYFFITVGWTGNRAGYMGWPELRSLHQGGQLIGAHGWTHTLLTHCSAKDLQKELNGARLMLEDKLGVPITTMSLPGGRYNRRVITACQEAGYTAIYTSIPRAETVPLGSMVGRLNIRRNMDLEYIAKVLRPESNVLPSLEREYQIKATMKTVLGDRLYEKLWAVLNKKERDTDGDWAPAE